MNTGKRAGAWRLTTLALLMSGVMAHVQHAAAADQAGNDASTTNGATSAAGASGSATDTALPATQVTDSALSDTSNGAGNGYVAKRTNTGSKTDGDIITNPQTISVVTRQQMDDQAAMTVDAALRYTTGVNSQDGSDIRFDQLRARGFDMDSYLDGLGLFQSPRFATPRIDPYLIDSINVLFGPSSVLYGQGSPGGLVDYTSKLPSDDAHNEVMLQIGNHDTYQVGFDVSGANKDGTILYRIVGLGRDAQTQASAIKDERIAIAPSITFRPDRDTSLTLLAGYQRDPEGGLFNPVPASGSIFYNPNGQLNPSQYYGDASRDGMQRTQYWFGYQLAHQFNDTWSVSQNARYLHVDQNYYQTSITSGYAADNATVYMWGNADDEHMSQWQIDTHAQAKFDTGPVQHTMLFGLDYRRVLIGDNEGGGLVGTINVFDPDYAALTSVDQNIRLAYTLSQVGVYAQDEIKFRKWVLTLGAREDWANTNSNTNGAISMKNDQAFTWRAGLAYQFDSGLVPYLSYATSFSPVLGTTASGEALKPTTGKQYELGLRYRPKGYNAYFRISAFNLTQDNVSVTDPNNTSYVIQTGQVRSRGIETEARADVTDNVKVIASYTFLNQVNTQSTTAQGKRPAITPRNNVALWADYTIHGGPLRNLGFGAGVRYMSATAGDVANSFEVPSRTLVDAAVHYALDNHWSFAINANNLFNKEYVSYCNSAAFCYWGATRTVLGTARYQW